MIIRRLIFAIPFCLALQCNLLTAQFDQFNFDRINTNEDAPNGRIANMLEDGFGFLWFATDEGLFRYDGYEFKAFRHDVRDSTTLSHPSLNTVLEDHESNIWVATTYGLNKLDRRTGTFEKILPFPEKGRKSKGSNYINSIFQDSRQKLWVVSRRQLLTYDISNGRFTTIRRKGEPQTSHAVRSFFEEPGGNVWAGADWGLLKIPPNDSTFQLLFPDPDSNSLFNREVEGVFQNKKDTFWLATQGGLANWNPQTRDIGSGFYPANLNDIPINALLPDKDGNLWLSFDKNGLGVFNPVNQHFLHFNYQPNQSNSLSNNSVTCLMEDQFQNIWIGTINGINKIKMHDDGFTLFQNEPGTANISNHAARVLKDRAGNIWTVTPEGVFQIQQEGRNGREITELNQFKEYISRAWFLEDEAGGIWLSMGANGIYKKDGHQSFFMKMPLSAELSTKGINRMMFDRKDQDLVWIGSTEGLCRLNRKTFEERWFRPLDDVPEIASNQVAIFEQFGEDEIWLYYTYSNSMGRFDKKTGQFELFVPPPEKSSTLEGAVKDIAIATDGNLWLATLYGLTNFNVRTKEFSIYGKKEGVLENELSTVLLDQQENVWVVGNRFFAKFDTNNKTFENYNIPREAKHFHTKSRYVAADGTILLGSINGVYAFHPEKISKNEELPAVVLTDFKVKNETFLLERAFEKTEAIILDHDQNDISFSFSALHFTNPVANMYKCRLIGFDEIWRELGHDHKVSYTNLNPGRYTFRVIASNSDGVWNEEGLKIQLTITPAFWQTLWFRSLIFLVVLSIGYALFKNRQHQLALQRQKELAEQSAAYKTKFMAEVSHEIRTPMNAIIGLSKMVLGTNLDEKQTKFVDTIQQSSKNLLTIINDLLDHTKLEAGQFALVQQPFDLTAALDQLNNTFSFKANEKKLKFEIIDDLPGHCHLRGDAVRLNQILTNLLGNAVKFTTEGAVWLKVTRISPAPSDFRLRFEVGDTGVGIAEDQLEAVFERYRQVGADHNNATVGTGLGLSIARQLVEQHGEQLFIESELGKGTRLWFALTFEKLDRVSPKTTEPSGIYIDAPLKILVVEDTELNQMVIAEMLGQYAKNASVEFAENGKIALDYLGKETVDIILMDVKMPVMDGFEATRNIRASGLKAISRLPIIAVTANAVPAQAEKCRQAGMDAIVTKPIDETELLKKIKSLVRRRSMIDLPRLKSLLGNNDRRVARFLDIFKTKSPQRLQSLKEALAKNDWGQVAILAHTIRGQCGYLGLDEMEKMALQIEQFADGKDPKGQIPHLLEDLEDGINGVIRREL